MTLKLWIRYHHTVIGHQKCSATDTHSSLLCIAKHVKSNRKCVWWQLTDMFFCFAFFGSTAPKLCRSGQWTISTIQKKSQYTWKRDINMIYSVKPGWFFAILSSLQLRRGKKILLFFLSPPDKNKQFNYYGLHWCRHSTTGRTQLGWHWPLGMGTRSGLASREIIGWCWGRDGGLNPSSTPS